MPPRNKICRCDINHTNSVIFPSVTAACKDLDWKITQRSHVCRVLKQTQGLPAYYSGYVWAYEQYAPSEPRFPLGKIVENTPYILLPTGEMYTASTKPYTLKTHRTTAEGRVYYPGRNSSERFFLDELMREYFPEEIDRLPEEKLQQEGIYIPVRQYDRAHNLLGEYRSISEAAEATGCNRRHISEVCSGKLKSTGGFVWSYSAEPILQPFQAAPVLRSRQKKVKKNIPTQPTENSSGLPQIIYSTLSVPPPEIAVGEWRDLTAIVERPGYWVSSQGKIYSERSRKILSDKHKTYTTITIRNREGREKGYQVHRMVAMAFIPNPNRLPYVNHRNRKTSDNTVENLEWVTASENTKHFQNTPHPVSATCEAEQPPFDPSLPSAVSVCGNYTIYSNGVICDGFRGQPMIQSSLGAGDTEGYLVCAGDYVHRHVAKAFCQKSEGIPEETLVVNHKDGNKRNNTAENLEWCTQVENNRHARETGLLDSSQFNKPVSQYDLNGNFIAVYPSVQLAAELTGTRRTAISGVLNGVYKTAGNYYWLYNGNSPEFPVVIPGGIALENAAYIYYNSELYSVKTGRKYTKFCTERVTGRKYWKTAKTKGIPSGKLYLDEIQDYYDDPIYDMRRFFADFFASE